MIANNSIYGIPVVQNQQEFIIGVFTISQILKFTTFTKRFIIGYDEENQPIYNDQIQRSVETSRVINIADFLMDDPEATFPTNLVLHIPMQVIKKQTAHTTNTPAFNYLEIELEERVYEEVKKELYRENSGNIFITIIDGQHRIRGIQVAIERLTKEIEEMERMTKGANSTLIAKLERYRQRLKDLLNLQLVVSFFIDKSLEYQAMIFATINRTQKRVSESLVYSLFGITTNDSPYKSALQIVYALNSHPKSPFFNRVKLYGGSYDTHQSPPLSQATMIKSIVMQISENLSREAERDRQKDRKDLFKRSPESTKYLAFRKYYAKDEDTKISDILFFYFSAVRKTFMIKGTDTSLWDFDPDKMKPTNVLQTTVGYSALLQLLINILEDLDNRKMEDAKFIETTYERYLSKTRTLDILDLEHYPFTSKTNTILYLEMSLLVFPPENPNDERIAKLDIALKK